MELRQDVKIIYIIDDKPDELASLFLLLQKLKSSWQVKAYSQPDCFWRRLASPGHISFQLMTLCPPCGAAIFWTGPEGAPQTVRVLIFGLHHKLGEAGRGTPLPGKTVQSRGDPAGDRCTLEAQERIENSNLGRVVQLRRGRQSVDRFC